MLMCCWATSSHLCLIVWFQSDSPCSAWSPLCPINACSPAILIEQTGASSSGQKKTKQNAYMMHNNLNQFCVYVSIYVCIYVEVKKSLSRVRLFATLWTIQSMGFSRPEYWSGQPFPSPGALPNPGIWPRSPALQADSLPTELPGKPLL